MNPFLQQVARHYLGAQGLEDYCFVFPNRRSGQFFAHYLQQELVAADQRAGVEQPHLMPCVTTINDLVARLTGTVAATDIEMMFALYDAYCKAMGDKAQELDKFVYWAQLMISDFNDIDRSLADAGKIYQNLDDLHSLSSNFLSDEVQEKVKRIFGEGLFTAFFDTSAEADLWQHHKPQASADGAVKQEFMSLWNALATICQYYHETLSGKGVVSPGMQLRQAVDKDPRALNYARYAFVGFGVLSAAEVMLFDNFRKAQNADFWWDNAGIRPMLEKAPHDPGALLIDSYCKRFGSMAIEDVDNSGQTIKVVSVPSSVGQAKQAFAELESMYDGEQKAFGIDTAIVLPDESLLIPLLHSVPDERMLNVTLGYSLRSSGIVSLMHLVARLNHQASKEKDELTYYREDVKDIMSHPLIKTYFAQDAIAFSAELEQTNRFRIPAREFEAMETHDLFTPSMDSGGDDVKLQQADYLDHLQAFCNLLMGKMSVGNESEESEDPQQVECSLQEAFLVMYIDVLSQLKCSLTECGQTIQRSSLFYLIDRLSSSAVIPFTGQPLRGLQIMGLLETRSLDFKNLVILSMNERVFPRRRSINSFIPNYIRRANGMSTTEQQEAIVAFNFYRLLNRASHVTLICDSSIQSMGSSEQSRYITQLEKVYGRKIQYVEMTPVIQTSSSISIQVPNGGELALRDRYSRNPLQGDGKYLSASAINKYINCPLMFYLHYVQGLNEDNEVSDFMDYGTFGNIIHDSLSECYQCELSRQRGGVIDREYIEFFKKKRLRQTVEYYIKKHFMHVPDEKLHNDNRPLEGEAFMLVETIESYIGFVLDYDIELIDEQGAFTVLECEKTHILPGMELGGVKFNFKYKPDRIDRMADGTVRIVDYKTGKDATAFVSAAGLPDLFDRNKNERCKAILQLMLYCYAYLKEHRELESVTPVIYKLSSMKDSGVKVKSGKKSAAEQYVFSLEDAVAQDFVNQMAETIRSLYEAEFSQVDEGAKACNYCRFIDFCRRTPVQAY